MPDASSPLLSAEQLLTGWTPRRIGRPVMILDETVSTNSAALEAAQNAGADGLAVLADYQSGGRGRHGHRWLSPRGASVLCSVALQGHSELGGCLTLAAAVAACDAISAASDVRPAIKWPNDLRIGGRKVGGILVESRQGEDRQR